MDKWCHMAIQVPVNNGPGNGVLPDGTKPLLEPLAMLINHQWGLVIWGQFHQKCSRCPWVKDMILKISDLRLHISGARELTYNYALFSGYQVECNVIYNSPVEEEHQISSGINFSVYFFRLDVESTDVSTVECRNTAVQFITISHTAFRWQQQNVN